MTKRISVPQSQLDSVKTLLSEDGIPLEPVTASGGEATFVVGEEKRECSGGTLYQGGWITCPEAWMCAGRLDLTKAQMGKLLNGLKIKVQNCQLGCF